MLTIRLNNGKEMPQIGLGVFRMHEEQAAIEAIKSAVGIGYRHIDTAAYYENEAAVGKAIAQSGLARETFFVTTKMWNDVQRNGVPMQAFEKSLQQLGFEYIDLYLVHWPVEGKVINTWHSMEKILQTGKVKSIGVSNHRICDLEAIKALGGTIPVVNQIELTPYFQQEELLAYCKANGIAVQAWGPLGSGKNNLLQEPALLRIAQKHGKSTAQVVLRWNLQRGVTPLPKSANPARQKENVNVFDFRLDEQDMKDIAKLETGKRQGFDPNCVDF